LAAPLAETRWVAAPADGSQSLSFIIPPTTRKELKSIFEGGDSGLAVIAIFDIDTVVDGVASGRISGAKLRSIAHNQDAVEVGLPFNRFINDVVSEALESAPEDRAYLTESARTWLQARLGPPEPIRLNGRLLYGWDMNTSPLATIQDQTFRVIKGAPRSLQTAAIVELGDVCGRFKQSIVDLDQGVQGCDSLE